MARGNITREEIAAVRAALVRLRGLKPFRGQRVLLRDVEQQLAELMAGAEGADGGALGAEARAEQAAAQRGAGI